MLPILEIISWHFSTRVEEHLGISFLTDLKLTSPPFNITRNYINNSDQNYNNDLKINQFSI